MEIKNFKRIDKGSLICSFDLQVKVQLTKDIIKLVDLRGYTYRKNEKGAWILPPSREYQDAMGTKKYYNYIQWEDRGVLDEIAKLLKPYLDVSETVPF